MNKQLLLSAASALVLTLVAGGAFAQPLVDQDANFDGGRNTSTISDKTSLTDTTTLTSDTKITDSFNRNSGNSLTDANVGSKNQLSDKETYSDNSNSFNTTKTVRSDWSMVNDSYMNQTAYDVDVQSHNGADGCVKTGDISGYVGGNGAITASANTGFQTNQGASNSIQAHSSF